MASAQEIYANQATAVVTSGGTAAPPPSAGSQEVWGVTSSAGLAAASSSAALPTQFHVCDVAFGNASEIVTVVNVSGTALTVVRGAENTAPVIHQAPFTVQQVMTSGGLGQLPRVDWLNAVTMFGADNSGSTNTTAALQAAMNVAQATGGGVYLPNGTYSLGSSLTVTLPFAMRGDWRDGTVLQLANGVNDYAIKFTQGVGTAITGALFSDFQINGNALNQTSGSGGINALGAVSSTFERIHFTSCFNWGLLLGAIPGGAFGHHNRIIGCTYDGAAAAGIGGGVLVTSSDENFFYGCDFQFLGGTAGLSGAGTLPVAFLDEAGLQQITSCCWVGSRGGNTNIIGYRGQNIARSRIIGCTFDGVGGDNVFIAGTDCIVSGCEFTSIGDQGPAGVAAAGVHLEFGNLRNVVNGNNFQTSTTTGKTGYFVYEQQIGNSGNNNITNNTLLSSVSGGSAIPPSIATILTQGSASIVRGNVGYNPIQHQTAPGIPSSGVQTVNPFNVDASVFVTGGTVSVIALGTVATGLTTGQVFVPAAGTITLTYTAAPAWSWFGC